MKSSSCIRSMLKKGLFLSACFGGASLIWGCSIYSMTTGDFTRQLQGKDHYHLQVLDQHGHSQTIEVDADTRVKLTTRSGKTFRFHYVLLFLRDSVLYGDGYRLLKGNQATPIPVRDIRGVQIMN